MLKVLTDLGVNWLITEVFQDNLSFMSILSEGWHADMTAACRGTIRHRQWSLEYMPRGNVTSS